MKPNRHILIHLDGPRSPKTVAVSLERSVVIISHFTNDGLFDSGELLDRPPTREEACAAICAAHRSPDFNLLPPQDQAGILWRLALVAAGLPRAAGP
ncbi:hypothetical protein TSH100_02945 [Azospirillum sp. TSH100]|uniref:hypothetical protein n=1 Tax=Azospirillum sp. TSH100 TaxID=652764 RepID=UPI000D6212DF|nr:hypothetical protein [Azospirillum sp. TSH100]PWC90266.1 hypothetical protein TSH100_02945 [Azospirillum sp. TSH100]QCG91362.1 hypothetical protein E6C72_26580 [Azospirillum sp. TSH100]